MNFKVEDTLFALRIICTHIWAIEKIEREPVSKHSFNYVMKSVATLAIIVLTMQPVNLQPFGFCYYHHANGLAPSDIDPHICTHIIVLSASVHVGNDSKLVADNEVKTTIEQVLELKIKNPGLKVSVSIKDEFAYWRYDLNREVISRNIVTFLIEHNLDGFDVFYTMSQHDEYSCSTNVELLNKLKHLFRQGTNTFLLTVCTSMRLKFGCDYRKLRHVELDFIIIRAYNFGYRAKVTAHESPLSASANYDNAYIRIFATDIRKNLNKTQDQIIIGFPSFSIPRILTSKSSNGVGASADYTRPRSFANDSMFWYAENDSVAYYRICSEYIDATYKWDDNYQSSYMYKNRDWLSFDSRRGLCYKTSWLARTNDAGGYMLWRLDLDDHKGYCGYGRFPIAKYLKDNIGKNQTNEECDKETIRGGRYCPKIASRIVPRHTYNISFTNEVISINCDHGTVVRKCIKGTNVSYWGDEENNDCQTQEEFFLATLYNDTSQSQDNAINMSRVLSGIRVLANLSLTNRPIATKMLLIIGNLMAIESTGSETDEKKWSHDVVSILEDFASHMDIPNGLRNVISTKYVSVGAYNISSITELFRVNTVFKTPDPREKRETIPGPRLAIPSGILQRLRRADIERIQVVVYSNSKLFTTRKSTRLSREDNVVSIVIAKEVTFDQDETVFYYQIPTKKTGRFSCVFWNETTHSWSTSGLVAVTTKNRNDYCRSTHLSSFCVLTSSGHDFSNDHGDVMNYLTLIGCGVSLISLLLTIVTYLLFKSLRRDKSGKILLNFCLSLILLNVFFLIFKEVPIDSHTLIPCMGIASGLHYFILTTLIWMMIEAVHMYQKLVVVFTESRRFYMTARMLVGWGLPLIVVIITTAVTYADRLAIQEAHLLSSNDTIRNSGNDSHHETSQVSNIVIDTDSIYNSKDGVILNLSNDYEDGRVNNTEDDDKHTDEHDDDHDDDNGDDDEHDDHDDDHIGAEVLCVLAQLNPLAFYAVSIAPSCVIIVFNTFVFVRVAMIVLRRSTIVKDAKTVQSVVSVSQVRGAISVMFVLGVTWIFGPLAIGPLEIPFAYVIAICNPLQGFLVFLFRCLLNTEARLAWKLFLVTGEFKKRRGPLSETSGWNSSVHSKSMKGVVSTVAE